MISESFNDFFVSIGKRLLQNAPNSHKKFHDFLHGPNSETCFMSPITEKEVYDIITNLRVNKSPGYDGLTNKLLKEIINFIIKPLTHILNLSIVNGIVPSRMKIAKVVPIFKKGDPHEVGNYRPISLLTAFSKILEKLIYARVIKFLKSCKILTPAQFGFREKHTTSHAILHFIDKGK